MVVCVVVVSVTVTGVVGVGVVESVVLVETVLVGIVGLVVVEAVVVVVEQVLTIICPISSGWSLSLNGNTPAVSKMW